MKNILKKALFAAALLSSSALASEGTYIGVGYHLGTYDETGIPKANPNGMKLKAGRYIGDNVAVEAHLYLGAGSDTVGYMGVDIDVRLKHAISVFVKGDIPLSESTNLYGLLGFTKGKLEASAFGESITEDDNGLSYGIGVESEFGNNLYISGEYIFYLSESDYDYTGFNIGLHKKF